MDSMEKFDLGSACINEARVFMDGLGEKPYRAAQVYSWIHQKQASDFDEMTDVPSPLRERLRETAFFQGASIAEKKEDADGTIKYLLELKNHNIIKSGDISQNNTFIETVFMDYRHGGAVCVSSQAGCGMGCVFCVSGKSGLLRDLQPGEMLAQVYAAVRDTGKPARNIVIMGSGEPLSNYDNTLRFIKLLNAPEGAGIGQRRITLSTCGLTDKIHKLQKENLQITLAVSLHAPNDRLRRELMPVAKAFPMDGLLEACKSYADTTKRRVTYEYAMIAGKNDAPAHAKELAARLRGTLCHVNLIPMNSGAPNHPYKPSGNTAISAFQHILSQNNIEVTVRRSLGSSINAACGQLRGGY